jgi:small ligand-binding sensory domain FIST
MSSFRSMHLTGSDWHALCDAIAGQHATSGNLAFVYLAEEFASDTDRIIEYLRDRTGVTHWVGCVGMGLCSNALETYDEPAISVLFTPFQDDDYRIISGIGSDPTDWLRATQAWRSATLASVGIVHADPSSETLPADLATLGEGLGGGFLVGGIASAQSGALQIADRAIQGGLSGVLLSGSVAVSTGLTQGCSLIGSKHRVTRCERNVIERIDDRPALDVLKEDIGEVLARDLSRIGGYIFAALPIPGSDTADYLVRNLVGIDPNRGLVAIGDLVEPGMDIQFARRDANTARADLERMVLQLRDRLPGPARGGLYHTCLGRGRHLFGEASAELSLIRDLLGDVPLAGFYANGEISHNRLYGYTGVLTLFS